MFFLITIVLTYLITILFGYGAHWALHQPWTGYFNESHMTHHLKLYPPEDFFSQTYRDAGADRSTKFFGLMAIPLIITPIILLTLGWLSLELTLAVLLTEGLVGYLHDYIHEASHIENHWLSRLPVINKIFAKWVRLHQQHHEDMNTNFGIFSFIFDKLFKTYVNK